MSEQITHSSFSQNGSLLVCTTRKFAMFSSKNYSLQCLISGHSFLSAVIVNNFIVAVCTNSSPPYTPFYLLFFNSLKNNYPLQNQIEFPSHILQLSTFNNNLFVSLENVIQIFSIKTMKSIKTIQRYSKSGLISVSSNFLAYSDDNKIGEVFIAFGPDFNQIRSIKCHNSNLQCIFVSDLPLLLTASHKGTVIRSYDIETGTKITECRRGMTFATVVSITATESFWVVCTTTSIHVFSLGSIHIIIDPSSPPVSSFASNDKLYILTQDGRILQFSLDLSSQKYQTKELFNVLSV